MGLGFVLSFGYWCTDFLVIQRQWRRIDELRTADTLIAAFPKMLFPFSGHSARLDCIALPTQNLSRLAGAHSAAAIEGKG